MADEVLVFVGSLNRAAPGSQGARGAGLSIYRFDEATGEHVIRLEEPMSHDRNEER